MTRPPTIHEAVTRNLEKYFQDLAGTPPVLIYDMVLSAVEKPMLEVVMKQAQGNQLKASAMLGINRNTLRKKLHTYGMLNGHAAHLDGDEPRIDRHRTRLDGHGRQLDRQLDRHGGH
jgi:Fis family transcriptional regulator